MNRFIAWMVYGLLGRAFGRERLAVWTGRAAYASGHAGRDSIWLRRNVHRLEKGLIMRPRRGLFAEEYIGETVECYARCCSGGHADASEAAWARDVLDAYFLVVEPSEVVDTARTRFLAVRHGSEQSASRVPYRRASAIPLQVGVDALEALCLRRRSVRWYLSRRVERDKIVRAIDIAKQAPSACNRQPIRFFVADDPTEAAAIAGLAIGTRGFAQNVPALAVIVGNLSAFPFERDRHVIYVDGALAAMQFMLALETLGLASCPVNWPDIDARESAMSQRLGLSPYERVVMLVAFGYPDEDGMVAFSQKRSDLLQWVDPAAP